MVRFGFHPLAYSTLFKKHAVAVGIKTVALIDGMTISAEDAVFPCEGTNQHEQSRFGQMKVGKQGVDDLKFVSGIDEEIGLAGTGSNFSSTLQRGIFEGADRGSTDGDNAARLVASTLDFFGRLGGD